MKKNTLFLLLIPYTIYLILNTGVVSAQGTSLRLSPSVIRVRLEPPTDLNAPVIIENLADEAIDLKTEFRLFKASGDGSGHIEHLPLRHNNSSIFRGVALMDGENNLSTLTLGPRQKKDLKLKINIEENQPSADYYFSVIFTRIQDTSESASDTKEQHSISRVNAGIAMNVLLSIQDQNSNTSTAGIDEFSSPEYIDKGPIPFILKLKNSGSNYISPKGKIEITNMFGQLIARVDIPATTVLANSSRYLANSDITSTPLSQLAVSGQQSVVPKVLWNEEFLLGFYTATVKIETSPDDPVLTRTIHFAALPFRLILSILTFAVIFLLIRKRVKRKMSTR